jgi:vitamin B12 transporter
VKHYFIIPLVAIAATATPAFAKENVEEVVVTATRTEQPITETLSPVTLITAADIERLQPEDLFDVLGRVPGINMRRNGGIGSTTGLFLRGASTNQTLVLVDGVRISSATSGTTALEHLDPDQIERIEVVRGSHSSLYGADAIGGVIQIFTKRGQEGFHPEVKLSVGTDALQEYQATLAGGSNKLQYRISSNHLQTDGFDRRNDGDDDAYRNTSTSAFLSWEISDQVNTEFSYQLSRGESEFDGTGLPFLKFRVESLSNKTVFDATENLKFTTTIARSTDLSDSRNDIFGLGFGSIKTRRDSYGLQSDYQLGEHQTFTLGAETYNDRVSGNTAYGESSRKNRAFYGQYQLNWGQFDFLAGWRKDDNEHFETANTRNLSLGYAINDHIKAIYSYSTGFKAPSFNDLYFPGFGNPSLKAERSKSRELTFKGNWDVGTLELSFFRTRYKDLIEFAFDPMVGYLPFNVGEARIKGFDIVAATELDGYDISGSYTWMDADDTSGAKDSLLRRRARRLLKIDVDKQFGQFSAGASLGAQSESPDGGTTVLPGYATVDLRLGYTVTNNLTLRLKVSNALDKDYQTINNYDEDGVNAVFSATYRL